MVGIQFIEGCIRPLFAATVDRGTAETPMLDTLPAAVITAMAPNVTAKRNMGGTRGRIRFSRTFGNLP
jgi:hypothetical protein